MERLKALRESKSMTQTQLGEYIGAKKSAVSLWESGKRQPDQETLLRIASIFDVSVDYLLGRDEKTEPIPEDEQSAEYMKLWPKMTKKDRAFILHMMRKMDEENQQ